ncbi:hypothetical protein DdX_08231 [Ditylenchus destructor]|uniref:Uncharacterized protein n=1 Tax=Ditylenchus destructor TaxID=166010 RepID=A0AAD4R7K8_9BILA|nr:hypothetical protein DdX_08231 [Ditylenchus destructor]
MTDRIFGDSAGSYDTIFGPRIQMRYYTPRQKIPSPTWYVPKLVSPNLVLKDCLKRPGEFVNVLNVFLTSKVMAQMANDSSRWDKLPQKRH